MSKKQNEQPTTSEGIIKKLDKILQTTYETIFILESCNKKARANNGRPESII